MTPPENHPDGYVCPDHDVPDQECGECWLSAEVETTDPPERVTLWRHLGGGSVSKWHTGTHAFKPEYVEERVFSDIDPEQIAEELEAEAEKIEKWVADEEEKIALGGGHPTGHLGRHRGEARGLRRGASLLRSRAGGDDG